jgi:ATP-binding cassette subfamily C protein CydC
MTMNTPAKAVVQSAATSGLSAPSAIASWRLFFRLLRLFRPYRGWMALGVALSGVSAIAGIGLMGMSGWFLASMGLAGIAGVSMNYFVPAAIIRGAAIVRTAGRYAERLINHDLTLRALSSLRAFLFSRLLPLAPAKTGFLGHSELFSRLRADVDRLEHAYLAVLLPILVAAIALPLVTVILACFVWQIAVVSIATVLCVGVILPYWLSRRSAAASVASVALETRLRALTSDALLGAAELRIYGGEARQAKQIAALTAEHGRHRRTLDRLQGCGGGLVTLGAQWTTMASLLLGARALQQHSIAPAELSMVVLLTLAQFEVLSSLPEAISQLGATLVSAARVFALIDAAPAVSDPAHPRRSQPSGTDIQFRDVSMRYGDSGHHWVLQGLNLDLPAGHRLAVVGASGAGKSSLIGALLRFHPIQSGRIELGGHSFDDYASDTVRQMIAVVEQRTHIFNGTLLDNLLVARPDANAEQIHAAITAAQLEPFVAGLPEGLNTWLGEDGVLLSGGEARRVAIARALLADRPILILDEPTEGLDASTAHSLMIALGRLMEGRSVLLITHRLDGLAALVDERVTLQDGKLVANAAGALAWH